MRVDYIYPFGSSIDTLLLKSQIHTNIHTNKWCALNSQSNFFNKNLSQKQDIYKRAWRKHQINRHTWEWHAPWGTKLQLWESVDKLDTSLAEAITLCNGIIVSTLLNSTNHKNNCNSQLKEQNENFCVCHY